MPADKAPVVTLSVSNISKLEQIEKWAELARGIRFPEGSTIEVDGLHDRLAVTCYLSAARVPEDT